MEAGALLGGSDIAGGFVSLAVAKSFSQPAQPNLHTWMKAGADPDSKLLWNEAKECFPL